MSGNGQLGDLSRILRRLAIRIILREMYTDSTSRSHFLVAISVLIDSSGTSREECFYSDSCSSMKYREDVVFLRIRLLTGHLASHLQFFDIDVCGNFHGVLKYCVVISVVSGTTFSMSYFETSLRTLMLCVGLFDARASLQTALLLSRHHFVQ